MKLALKTYLVIALLSLVYNANAQTYRLEVGYNIPERFGSNISTTYFNGVKVGGTAEFKLKNNFSLLTGALYNYIYSDKIQGYPNLATVRAISFGHFLDIPARFTYTYPLTKSLKVFGFAGPNLNIGLFQTMKTTSTVSYIPSANTDLYKDNVLNRINLQIGLGGGVQWKKYQLKASYDFGINNLNRSGSGNIYQKGWYISVAYDF